MKVTVLFPDQLIEDVKAHAKGQTLTESIDARFGGAVQLKKIARLNEQVRQQPLEFAKGFFAVRARKPLGKNLL